MQWYSEKLTRALPIAITAISLAAANVSAYEKPSVYQRSVSGTQIVCVPSIDGQRRLVDTLYGEIEDSGRSYLVRLSEKIVKESARPEDLKWHKSDCSPKRHAVTADILR